MIKKIFNLVLICFLGIFFFALFILVRYPMKYMSIIQKNALERQLEPTLICAIIHAESKFRVNAISYKGASGLMQLTNDTADWMAEKMRVSDYNYEKILDPELNISIGSEYLSWLLNRYENNIPIAAAAYNAGSGNVDKWLKNSEYSKDGSRLDNIPFKETKDYVERVLLNKKIYEILFKIYLGKEVLY